MAEPRSVPTISDPFPPWLEALAERHLAELTFSEVRRGLEALSAVYVERRDRLGRGAALDGAGKRAAFALFYGPLHFLVTREVARALALGRAPVERVVDLGCGTGAAGSALALELGGKPALTGVDVNRWALDEARWTWRHFGLRGQARAGDAARAPLGGAGTAHLAAYTLNELEQPAREAVLTKLLAAARAGAHVLVIEPIARRPLAWWDAWEARFAAAGGRADTWRFALELPERLALLDRAAGLRHDALKARTLYAGPLPAVVGGVSGLHGDEGAVT